MTDLLTADEAARMLGCSARTVHRKVAEGQLDVVRRLPGPNGAYLFELAAVEQLVKARAAKKARRAS